MRPWSVAGAAEILNDAQRHGRVVAPLTQTWGDTDLGTAYRVQHKLIELKEQAGETVVGFKLGLTSEAKQQQMGVASPLTAWLTGAMSHTNGQPLAVGSLIHPRVEPEIAFELGTPLRGPGITVEDVMGAVAGVRAAFEVIDSRFQDFRFALPDVVADNASAARFVLGDVVLPIEQLDLASERCVFSVDGVVVGTATGSAVQGHPARALAMAVNDLADRGQGLEAGWTVLTGSLTDAVPLLPGSTLVATFDRLREVRLSGV